MIDINSLLIGGVGVGILGTLFQTIKSYGQWLFNYSTRYFVTRLRVNGEDSVYHSLNAWFNQTEYAKQCSILELGSVSPTAKQHEPVLNPGPGLHWFKHNGLRILMVKTDAPKTIDSNSVSQTRIKTIDLTIFSRNKEKIHDLFKDIANSLEQQSNIVKVYKTAYGGLLQPKFIPKRPLESIFLNQDIKTKLVKDLDWFFSAQEFFTTHHIPYKRGYLFQGIPGTGKTSLVHAIASRYSYNIVNLGLGDLSPGELQSIVNNLPPKSIILVEDVDAIFNGRKNEQKQQNGVSFNDFINMLDGFETQYGQIVILTTNHPEKLDPALSRSGRIDFVLNFTYASDEVILAMINSFTSDSKVIQQITSCLASETTTAELQEMLLSRFTAHDTSTNI